MIVKPVYLHTVHGRIECPAFRLLDYEIDEVVGEFERRKVFDEDMPDTRSMAKMSPEEQRRRGINGVAIEFVTHVATGWPWTGRGGSPKDIRPDVGKGSHCIEDKWSEHQGIILKELWNKPRTYGWHVLGTGDMPIYTLLGWYDVLPEDYERPMQYRPGNPTWTPARIIPRSELLPISDLFVLTAEIDAAEILTVERAVVPALTLRP
jgi:hypothetical protein